MLSVLSTPDEDPKLVEFLAKTLEVMSEDKASRVCICYRDTYDNEVVCYYQSSYKQLRDFAEAISDEATIRMIAENQDRIEKFIPKDDYSEDTE